MTKKFSVSNCAKLFVDFDGVLVDSNRFKEDAIHQSIKEVAGNTILAKEAIDYFNEYAGISRKVKLRKYFKMGDVDLIMQSYGKKCREFFVNSKSTSGSIDFLKRVKAIKPSIKVYILSGGEKEEIRSFILKNKMDSYFNELLCSEESKSYHLKRSKANRDDIFIGDSKSDLSVALSHPLKFIYVDGFVSDHSSPTKDQFDAINITVKNLSELEPII
ncbi:HAD family hydrolase [Prochlorococcus marinus]|uniref:Predicted phosphatase n=1 Tax=Prochlorococcus marinus (strain MIT 9211) TaxID=93059 RepID=A9BBK4_PROM4|nr:HAD hydrolase-like protein [Prochlorococcus marinus]ABX09216.1 Predicted phosphatase [Prochlorococcus marinus str. MIT 9211]